MKRPLPIRLLLPAAVFVSTSFLSAAALATSSNVAIVPSTSAASGGTLPTTTSGPTGAFTAFTFTVLPVANVNAANLAAFDTVLLNMASSGIACNSTNLGAGPQAALVNFVNTGGKLIIYDSECPAVDYSWLPFHFTTSNPGQLGATGTLVIDVSNELASSVASDPKYINAPLLASGTDAVGDMNILNTKDPDWCLSMSGTNAIPATGPVHVYGHFGSGLIIWNGLDIDVLGSGTSPDSANASGNLAKIWLQELQATGSNLVVCQSVAPATTGIPTMTEWGMAIMALLLAGTGVFFVRSRRKA